MRYKDSAYHAHLIGPCLDLASPTRGRSPWNCS
jgi:hypothetical protein